MSTVMKKYFYVTFRFITSILLVSLSLQQNSIAVGLMPIPEFNSFKVGATVVFDSNTERYFYNYTFGNPVTNSGSVWQIKLDITQPS